MVIFDYIFYRVYIAYRKADEFENASSILYLSACCFALSMPLLSFIYELMRGVESIILKIICGLFMVLITLCMSVRYLMFRKFEKLEEQFRTWRLNVIIPTWCFWFVLPICFALGLIGMFVTINYIIKPHHMFGIGYRWLCEVLPGVF